MDIRSANEEIKQNNPSKQLLESDDGDIFINWKQIVDNIENGNNTQLVLCIAYYKQRLVNMKDDKGFTLLHHSALKMKADKIKLFIDYARRTQNESD